MSYKIIYPDELYHFGVKGMKWGVRRKMQEVPNRIRNRKPLTSEQKKKIAKTAGIAAASGLTAYGAYKFSGGISKSDFGRNNVYSRGIDKLRRYTNKGVWKVVETVNKNKNTKAYEIAGQVDTVNLGIDYISRFVGAGAIGAGVYGIRKVNKRN